MTLNLALFNALSALQTYSQALNVTAQNISNVNTEGYSRKIVHLRAVTVDGEVAGVEISSITRKVNDLMVQDLRGTTSLLGDARVRDEFYGRLQDLFGSLRSNSSTGANIAELAASLQALADTPESISQRSEVIDKAKNLVAQLKDIGDRIETFRLEVDRNIDEAIDDINAEITLVQQLNLKIAEALLLNLSVSELEDQRDISLNKIADQMGIKQFARATGELVIFTEAGRALVDGTARTLTHDAATSFNPQVTWAEGGIQGITLGGGDITSEIKTGRIAGLIALRDTILPDLHSQFQELATALHDELNVLHNQGTGFPGVTTTTGTRTVASGDTPVWTGNFRVTALDTAGKVVETTDFSLASYTTIGALVTAIDGMTNVTASITGGKVVIAATGSSRVAFNELTSAVTVADRTLGASDFLGLNDLFSSGNEYDDYASSQRTSKTTALGLTGTLTFKGIFGTTTVAYTSGNTLDDVKTAINGNATLTTAGISASVVTDGSGFRLRITDAGGDNFFITDSSNLISTLNIKVRDTGITGTIAVNSAIVADPSRLSRGELSASGSLTVGNVGVTAGDKSIVQKIANKFNSDVSFTATGGLPASASTFSEFATEILALNATQARSSTNLMESRQVLFDTLKARVGAISGVNLDEEMAQLIILENAYAAAARLVSVVEELYALLLELA